jgi:transglutaminase-like putative cysteine protease
VLTFDTGGVVRGLPEKLPPEVYLRDTPLTCTDASLGEFVRDAGAGQDDPLAQLHALLGAIHRDLTFDTAATDAGTSAVESFAIRRGVCQDLSHVFIAGARLLGFPARYVSGHLVRLDTVEQDAAHAWAEAFVPDLGWVGFDPANGISPTEFYVRVAVGLDYLAAAPVRGARQGGGQERMTVRLAVQQAQSMQQ